MVDKVKKSDEEWRSQLNDEEYRVTRCQGTERAFTGEFFDSKQVGNYHCTCCGQLLFDSNAKYDSGSGWPSFCQPADLANVEANEDQRLGMSRIEVLCSRCDAHLGHVFPDGPEPTGQRYCINSASLKFAPSK